MIAIIAPARNTKPEMAGQLEPATRPLFAAEVETLVKHLRTYTPWQLESLLDVPPERAFYFYTQYAAFSLQEPGTPALLSFHGQAYRNMRPHEFDARQLAFAQEHLRIMSALYGMLRPLDGILDHRLGLKKECSPGGQSLHEFWGDTLYKELFKTGGLVVNLASVEYAKLVVPHMQPGNRMLTCRFLVDKPGGAKGTVSTIRAARGLMARFIIENGIDTPEGLKLFDLEGYEFIPARSAPDEYVFVKRRSWEGYL